METDTQKPANKIAMALILIAVIGGGTIFYMNRPGQLKKYKATIESTTYFEGDEVDTFLKSDDSVAESIRTYLASTSPQNKK